MPYHVPIEAVKKGFPQFSIISPLTPSEQKAAFHVRDSDGKDLCLKLISPKYDIDRLTREIRALQNLDHPNVVKLIEYTFTTKNNVQLHYMIEEFVDGEDLADVLEPAQPWPLIKVVTLFSQIAEGLSAIAAIDVVHRDLKPQNIRVRTNGEPVIIDFGLARHLSLPDLTNTGEGADIGTPKYFAPEQFTGTKHDIDHRTDLFALGTIMYEALTGFHPFYQDGMSYEDLKIAVCSATVYLKHENFIKLPRKWRLLLSRLLEKERARRPTHSILIIKILHALGEIQ